MSSVMCPHFSMEKADVLEHTDASAILCTLVNL